MENIILKPVDKNDWEKVLFFERNANSDVFHAYNKEEDIKEYINNSKIFFITLNSKEIWTISYEKKDDNLLHFNWLIVSNDYRWKWIWTLAIKKMLSNIDNDKKVDLVVHPKNTWAVIVYLKAWFKIEWWKENFFWDWEDRLYLVKR